MFTCFDVANFFINLANETGSYISNLKLQKLVYYAQAWYLALYNDSLFPEDFQAWIHSPVIPVLYAKYSDGTLRAICLITLLLQPEEQLPKLIIVDEPELGLHPYALNIIAALFKKDSLHTQILISTQSSIFLDNFEPEDVTEKVKNRNLSGLILQN